jgi:hypothetical protein
VNPSPPMNPVSAPTDPPPGDDGTVQDADVAVDSE